ncbi:MAG: serine/threonine protein kinase [Chloroflexi bacterium]|nr:serine/threonine protein kinase [Chloroflexota bacterium]
MDVGVEFSHYRIVEHVGRGGMADVWSARDKRLQRTVAIKTIARDLSQDVEPVKLFEREARTIAQLEHPHILPIYDFGEYDSQLYIVMRYVTGGSLESLLAQGPLPIPEAMRYARAIAAALDYAHSSNVIHLDLKPSNILMDSTQSPYLADFGLATVLGPEGRAANPGYGTLLYMAPEQLTSSQIDHRADIYSFAILMFQMFTGELPFDATTSLALKQIQWQEDLPELTKLGEELAELLTPVLRRGTALDVNSRPNRVIELVEAIEAVLAQSSGVERFSLPADDLDIRIVSGADATVNLGLRADTTQAGQEAMARMEAKDIYNKARRAWIQGRFLLGVTHFMLMNDYYMRAAEHNLELDDQGKQMLLRGALEYDTEIDYWWNQLDNDNRRWVALHAVRSENAPARVRAIYRLETLPDSDPPKIPMLVAQALSVETNEQAKRAAIHVLGTRAKLHAGITSGVYPVVAAPASGVTARLLTATARVGIQLIKPNGWREIVYTDDIDELLANNALDASMPAIAELAARTIGRIRSLTALKVIAEAQRAGEKGALRALAFVRDEAPSLPPVVSPQGRLYAWLANTWRRMTDDPLHNVWRFVFALLGGALAMGAHVFITFRSEAIFNADRWGKTISIGLTFGMFVATLVFVAGEFSSRVRGFWPWWARVALSTVAGFIWGTLSWGAFTWFFFNYVPDWGAMAFAGLGLALGFVLTAALNLRSWAAVVVTTIAIYLPIYVMFQFYWTGELMLPVPLSAESLLNPLAILYYDNPDQIFTVALPVALLIAIGGHAQALWYDGRNLMRRLRLRVKSRKPELENPAAVRV